MVVFIVGHVTKDGNIAGPRVLEHIVDTVLYFEGDRHEGLRLLRAVKNRFGSTNEVGVFEMGDGGMREVADPSRLFLSGESAPGCCVTCAMEGSRPILAEVQSLLIDNAFGNPRRTSAGVDIGRLSLLLAVLEKESTSQGFYEGRLSQRRRRAQARRAEHGSCGCALRCLRADGSAASAAHRRAWRGRTDGRGAFAQPNGNAAQRVRAAGVRYGAAAEIGQDGEAAGAEARARCDRWRGDRLLLRKETCGIIALARFGKKTRGKARFQPNYRLCL